jgi:hypothetical protein
MLPEFDRFLFASVGEEIDGVPLSVLSALSQLDLDPRDEAARLSHLTKEAAAEQLARIIARLSDRRWTLSEARRIAAGLIERLPPAISAAEPDRLETGAEQTPDSRAIWLALLTALLVSFIVGGFIQHA